MKRITRKLAAVTTAGGIACATSAIAADDVVIVYDASGSMWGQIDGTSKIEIARDVMADLVDDWDSGTNLGLVAYGHRRQGDCTDIETLIAPGTLDKASFIDTVNAIRPVGKTPISASVQHTADLLSYRDNKATVVLISDGVETCNADPCALSAQLAKQGVKFTAHVVGFDLKDEAHASLSCIAENTGGVFVPASNADELHAALDQVQAAMDVPRPVPEPEPEPELPEASVTGPEQVTTGAAFDVSWSEPINGRDMVTILPMGTDEGTRGAYLRVGDKTGGSLKAPAEPGLYELRYILDVGSKTLATAPIEVVEAEIGIAGPGTVRAGNDVDVSWSAIVNGRDMISILPMGTDEGTRGDYMRIGDKTEGRLKAPDTPGLYEIRYILDVGSKTLASTPLEVVGADAPLDEGAGLSVPGSAAPGETITVTWTGGGAGGDERIALARKDQPDFSWISAAKIGDAQSLEVKMPAEAGLYEVRFLDVSGQRLLGRSVVEVK